MDEVTKALLLWGLIYTGPFIIVFGFWAWFLIDWNNDINRRKAELDAIAERRRNRNARTS